MADASNDLRASDAERNTAVQELSEHFTAGRLDPQELDNRSGRALQARTRRELTQLFTDLPHLMTATPSRRPARRPRPILAVGLIVTILVTTRLAFGAHHGPFFPWFLIPLVFLVSRGVRRKRRWTNPQTL